jgi:hypothetical protein
MDSDPTELAKIIFDAADSAWWQLRRQCIKQAKHRCQRCNSRSPQLTAHHLQPRQAGGPDALHNLICLCNPCHDFVEIKTAEAGRSLSPAEIQGSYEPPSPEPLEWQGKGVLTRYFARKLGERPAPWQPYAQSPAARAIEARKALQDRRLSRREAVTAKKPDLRHPESHDAYERVVTVIDDKSRVIECPAGIQWIVQKAIIRGGRRTWDGVSFCQTKEALLRCAGDHPALHALPDWFPQGFDPPSYEA